MDAKEEPRRKGGQHQYIACDQVLRAQNQNPCIKVARVTTITLYLEPHGLAQASSSNTFHVSARSADSSWIHDSWPARHWIWRLPECDPQLAQERRTVYFAESGQQDFVARALKASSHPCQLLLLAVGSSCILRDLLVEDTKNVKTCTTSAVLPLFLSLDRPVEVLADVLRGEGNHAEARLQ